MPISLRVRESRVGVVTARTRMPFRFGVVTMRTAAVATLEVTVEDSDGRRTNGYAADMLVYKWFDKDPAKTPLDNVRDLLSVLDTARGLYLEAGTQAAETPFALWRSLSPEIERRALDANFNRLGAGFGSSMLERAVIDAAGRLSGTSLWTLLNADALGIEMGSVHGELAGRPLAAFLPSAPLRQVHLRHTVGLLDPVRDTDLDDGARIGDGLPETLEDYILDDGVRYLKVKVAGDTTADLDRLRAIADVILRNEGPFLISLDGNEQYHSVEAFQAFIDAVRADAKLARLFDHVAFIEQPLARAVALDEAIGPAMRQLNQVKPVIIDESDGWVTAFRDAMALGYRGVSHKNCKGIYKSLMNLALAKSRNAGLGTGHYFLSAEDLTNLGVVPLQADLAMVAALGIPHVERNGHHYFHGLDHLSPTEQEAALQHHSGLYTRHNGGVVLRIKGGRLDLSTLQCAGMGFDVPPDLAAMTPAETWSVSNLSLDDAV